MFTGTNGVVNCRSSIALEEVYIGGKSGDCDINDERVESEAAMAGKIVIP